MLTKDYNQPEIFEFGSVTELTGHCSSGCGHDSVVHTDEYKEDSGTTTLEAEVAC